MVKIWSKKMVQKIVRKWSNSPCFILNLFILVSMPYYMISFASRLVGMITSLFRSEIFPLCTFTFCSTERL